MGGRLWGEECWVKANVEKVFFLSFFQAEVRGGGLYIYYFFK